MLKTIVLTLSSLLLLGTASLSAHAQEPDSAWHLTGHLSEACSCSVPCACNFGESPSPHSFCFAVWSLDIQKGRYGDVTLDGLHFAAANANQGMVWYIDGKANKIQAEALRHIGTAIWKNSMKANGVDFKKVPRDDRLLGFKSAPIEQVIGEKSVHLKIGTAGGFDSDYIMGLDGKSPVIVENNYSWNIQHGIKAKTKTLHYKDSFGNKFTFTKTNSNQGEFDWSDTTPIYFR